jgi:DNA processing protein
LNSAKAYWIGLNHVKGIGAVRFRALLAHFGDAQTAWQASTTALIKAGLSSKVAEELAQVRNQFQPDQIMEQLDRMGIQALTWEDETYPRLLKNIDQPPPVLYVCGRLSEADEWSVAIVGTRRVTHYGRQVTEEIASFLAANGITVVSGLARGVDAIAHNAALRKQGRTIAVLGNGLDTVYPPEHEKLAAAITHHGALVSDYPPGTEPLSVNFPPRNRIISGLSLATVIVEAGVTSGALITAKFAADQGRDVLAVPGNIYHDKSKGTNRLIQQGAFPILEPGDILEALNLNLIAEHQSARANLPMDPVEAQLFQQLGPEPVHIDELSTLVELPIETITATLTMLELKGFVRQVGGMQYIALREQALEDEGQNYQVN